MIHRIPPGTRDILPDEMRELRRLHLAMIDVFESRGYGEVAVELHLTEAAVRQRVSRGLRALRRRMGGAP